MNRFKMLLLTFLGGSMISASGFIPYPIEKFSLDNGLKVIMVQMPESNTVAYWTIVRTGSRDEVEKGVTGFAHFFEHMMFRGTKKYPANIYNQIVSSIGADSNAFTTFDFTAYYLVVAPEELPIVIEIESDRFKNLSYNEKSFKTEAGAIYGEYRKAITNPYFLLYKTTFETAFTKHTYGHTVIGFEEDIKNMPKQYEYSKKFYKRYYRPDNTTILVIGKINPREVRQLIEKKYRDWKPGYTPPKVPKEPLQKEPKTVYAEYEGKTLPLLSLSFKCDSFAPKDKVYVAGTVLGELIAGRTSKLYKKLVLDEKIAEEIGTDFPFWRDPGLWEFFFVVKDNKFLPRVEAEAKLEIEKVRSEGIDPEILDKTKKRILRSALLNMDSPRGVAYTLIRVAALTGDIEPLFDYYKTLQKIEVDDVIAAAKKYLDFSKSTKAVVYSKGTEIPKVDFRNKPVKLKINTTTAAIEIMVKGGSIYDPKGKEGLSAIVAALLEEGGSKNKSYKQILDELYPLGASFWTRSDKEVITLFAEMPTESVLPFYSIFREILLKPGFREEDLERIKEKHVSFLKNVLRYSSDEELGKAVLYSTIFKGTPYEHHTLGKISSISSITVEDVKNFYNKFFTLKNITFGAAGNYPDELFNIAAADFSSLPEGEEIQSVNITPSQIKGRKVVLVEKPTEAVAISFGYPIEIKRGDKDFYPLYFLASWLGEHRNSVSHLYQVIREKRGLNYGDYAYIEYFPEGGRRQFPPPGVPRNKQIFEVWLRPLAPDNAIFALRAAIREIDLLAKNGLNKEEFEKHKKFITRYVNHLAQDPLSKLGYRIDDSFYGIENHLQTLKEKLAKLTLEEVNRAAKKYIQTENLVIVMVVPDAKRFKETLISGKPTPVNYGGIEKSKEILEEDKIIERYPLNIKEVEIVPVENLFN